MAMSPGMPSLLHATLQLYIGMLRALGVKGLNMMCYAYAWSCVVVRVRGYVFVACRACVRHAWSCMFMSMLTCLFARHCGYVRLPFREICAPLG